MGKKSRNNPRKQDFERNVPERYVGERKPQNTILSLTDETLVDLNTNRSRSTIYDFIKPESRS